jgi:uncharacterized protein YhaN
MSLRFDRFELRAFGPFTGTTLELQGSPGSLHLICGANEVGKSTTQRAIGDFLFGIPARSTDNQLHDYTDMRLGAVLVDETGCRHDLVRRKGSRSTLLGVDGQPVDEGGLERMLAGLTRPAFEAMFSITHDSLVIGGRALLAAGGEVGESLFSASLGASTLHQLREQLDAEADELFRPRASSSLILQARARLDAAEQALREGTLRATAFIDNERQFKTATDQRRELADRLRTARIHQNSRRRMRAIIPALAEHDAIELEIADLGAVPSLSATSSEDRVRILERETNARAARGDIEARIEHLEKRLASLPTDDPHLARELAIKDLHGRSTSVRENVADLERQVGKLDVATGLARQALDEIRPELKIEEADRLMLDNRRRARIDKALATRAGLLAALAGADEAYDEAHRRADGLRREIEQLPDIPDTVSLEATVGEVLAAGPLEQRLREAEETLHLAEDQLGAAISELRPSIELEVLRSSGYPSSAEVERFSSEQAELGARHAKLIDRRDHLDTEFRNLDEDAARLELDGDVPTFDALIVVRDERDKEWVRLRRRLEGGIASDVSPDAFERRVRDSDEIADALCEHADTTARRRDLTVRRQRLEADQASLDLQTERLERDQQQYVVRWRETWSAVPMEPRSPREMSEWLGQRQNTLDRTLSVAGQQRTVSGLRESGKQHRTVLANVLARSGHSPQPEARLGQLTAVAQAVIAAAETDRGNEFDLRRQLQAAEAAETRELTRTREFRKQIENWCTEWTQTIGECGWSAGIGAEDARQVLLTLDELTTQLKEIAQLRARVNGIEQRIQTFQDDAATLISDVGSDLREWPVLDAVAELARRLDGAVDQRSRRRTLEGELETARADLDSAMRAVQQAENELARLIAAAGAQTIEELPALEERSNRLHFLRSRMPEVEQQITEVGQAPLRELIERSSGASVDLLDAEIETAELEAGLLEEQLGQLDVRLGEIGSQAQSMEQAGGAADAGQLVEQRRAELRELVERYMRVQVAAWALAEAIDQYRREHKDPLLRRADELFPQLTCGSFKALEVGFDAADDPTLLGIRSSGEQVHVERMSTGTREQLYLALRLASLERHVELHGPMPIILDDVVLHSDPKRKTAILLALAQLSRATQVIAFSHDPQVVALAQGALDPELVTLHELGSTEIANALHPATGAADVHPFRRQEAA